MRRREERNEEMEGQGRRERNENITKLTWESSQEMKEKNKDGEAT